MNFIALESERKLRGGFYTDPAIGAFLADWLRGCRPARVLEPSCGDGALLAAVEQAELRGVREVVACEIDPGEAAKAASRTRLPVTRVHRDFLDWYLSDGRDGEPFDAVVGNPPFIRYQYLPERQQQLAEQVFAELGLPFTRHTNAWVPFVVASIRLLRGGGRLAMVLPAEILHIPHARSLRRYLAAECSRVVVLDPEEIWFPETLQGTVVVLAEKRAHPAAPRHGVAVRSVPSRAALAPPAEDWVRNADFADGGALVDKWMPVLLSPRERELVRELRLRPQVACFADVATVDVGIVTGANQFFVVADETVEEFGLERWAHPMFGRSEQVRGLVFDERDHADNRSAGRRASFLWLDEDAPAAFPPSVQRYLELGRAQGLHTRFKCRTRRPWYRVPSVYASPVAMLKRAHHYPRLVLNQARAFTTDTAYRIRPTRLAPERLVVGFVNSLTCLSAELEGRHYGGGVLELVPSEIERLLLPIPDGFAADLREVDAEYRRTTDPIAFLERSDGRILTAIGVSPEDCGTLREAWHRLRDRRHRRAHS